MRPPPFSSSSFPPDLLLRRVPSFPPEKQDSRFFFPPSSPLLSCRADAERERSARRIARIRVRSSDASVAYGSCVTATAHTAATSGKKNPVALLATPELNSIKRESPLISRHHQTLFVKGGRRRQAYTVRRTCACVSLLCQLEVWEGRGGIEEGKN